MEKDFNFLKWLKKKLQRETKTKECLIPYTSYESPEAFIEATDDLRQAVLDIFYNGVLGSDVAVPTKEGQKGAVFLPILLNYEKAKPHWKALHGILTNTEGTKVKRGYGEKSSDEIGGTLLTFSKESFAIEVSRKITNRFSLSWGIDRSISPKNPIIAVSLTSYDVSESEKDNSLLNLRYNFGYESTSFFDTDNAHIAQKKHENTLGWPAVTYRNIPQALLGSFIFSQVLLEDYPNVFGSLLVSKLDAPFLTIDDPLDQGNSKFRTIDFTFDVEAAIAYYKKGISFLDPTIAAVLEQRKEMIRSIQIVNLGYTTIRGKKFYIYSGAEKPLAKENQQSKARTSVSNRNPQGIGSPLPNPTTA